MPKSGMEVKFLDFSTATIPQDILFTTNSRLKLNEHFYKIALVPRIGDKITGSEDLCVKSWG